MTACQEDSFSYVALMQTFILQRGFSVAHAVLFLMGKKKIGVSGKCCHTDVPDETGTTSHFNNHPMDPSSWAETCLSNLGSKWSPRMEGGMQECPQPVPAVAPLAAVPLLARALTWAEHGPTEELNCAFAVLHRNIWLKAYRKISEEEFCSGNINLILHEVKSIFVVWVLSQGLKAMCCSISPNLGYLPPFPPQTTAVFYGEAAFFRAVFVDCSIWILLLIMAHIKRWADGYLPNGNSSAVN